MRDSEKLVGRHAKEPIRQQGTPAEDVTVSTTDNPVATIEDGKPIFFDIDAAPSKAASDSPADTVDFEFIVDDDSPSDEADASGSTGTNADGLYDYLGSDSSKSKHHHHHRSRRRRRRKILITILVVILVLAAAVGFSGYKVYSSAQDLRAQAKTAVTQLNQVQASLEASNFSEAVAATEQLQKTADSMSSTMNTPWWGLASIIPYYGDDVTVAKTLVNVLDDVTTNALTPLTKALEAHPPTTLVGNGTIDIENFKALMNVVQTSIPVIKRNAESLERMPEAHVDQLATTVAPIKEKFLSINDSLEAVDAFAPILATLLGADGDRLYLITAQNSAETRSTGGFPGAMGTLSISGGTLSFGDFDKCVDVVGAAIPDRITITDNENELFDYEWMHYVPNVGYNPDFPRVASIWAAGYERINEKSVDGVISMTPAIIQDLLSITGGITLSDGTYLDGTNATKVLQSDLYWKYFSEDDYSSEAAEITDDLFAEVAASCVHQLFDDMNPSKLLGLVDILKKHVDDRTAMLWLSNEAEQQRIEALDCSGALNSDSKTPKIGTYFNACMASKLGWYADMETTIGEAQRNSDGTTSYQCKTTFRNAITQQEVAEGRTYLVGQFKNGNMLPWIYITAPAGGSITDFKTSDGQAFSQGTYKDLQVWYIQEGSIPPGGELVCTYTVTVSKDAEEPLGLSATPMLTEYR
ncbi:MAG: DUF4012 domain-containing protein [Eggerthellaceae bacterium]|nr:DUF4012 domain-containing protein [Eggerthellaceae bacterium]